jgi:hypothetical protein
MPGAKVFTNDKKQMVFEDSQTGSSASEDGTAAETAPVRVTSDILQSGEEAALVGGPTKKRGRPRKSMGRNNQELSGRFSGSEYNSPHLLSTPFSYVLTWDITSHREMRAPDMQPLVIQSCIADS